MGFGFSLLDKRADENLLQFDNRISHMLPFVSGTAYFAAENYVPYAGEFGLYIKWNSEINYRLNDRLPSEGFIVKATSGQAAQMCDMTDGVPVYIKLISREGRLYPYRTYITVNGRPFSVEYTGNQLVRAEASDANEISPCDNINGSRRGFMPGGSQRGLRLGSQRFLLSGSQGRLLFGSNRGLYSFGGSQRRFLLSGRQQRFFLGGSQRRFLLGGSQRIWSHEWEWEYRTGSQRARYSLGGSQRSLFTGSNRGLYSLGGSQRWILTGSQRSLLTGSNRGLYGMTGSQRKFLSDSKWSHINTSNDGISYLADIPYWHYMPKEWQMINESRRPGDKKGGNGKFGYGLDLI